MKNQLKLASLLLALAIAAGPTVRAEDVSTDKPDTKHERGPGARLERLAKELGLNADQQTKWKALGQQEKAAMDVLRDDTTLAKKDKRAKGEGIWKSFMDQRRALLTPDQAKQFDTLLAKMKERRERGPGGDKPPTGQDDK